MSPGTDDVRMCSNCGCAIWSDRPHICSGSWGVVPESWVRVEPAASTMVEWHIGSAEPGESWAALLYMLAVAFLVGLVVGLRNGR